MLRRKLDACHLILKLLVGIRRLRKFFLYSTQFSLQMMDCAARFFIDDGLVLDEFGSLCKHQSWQWLSNVLVSRCHVCDNYRLTVSTERVTEQESQLTVSVMYVACLSLGYIDERVNHNTKCSQTLIDHTSFFESFANSIRWLRSLRTSQVDDVESWRFHLPYSTGIHSLTFNLSG